MFSWQRWDGFFVLLSKTKRQGLLALFFVAAYRKGQLFFIKHLSKTDFDNADGY